MSDMSVSLVWWIVNRLINQSPVGYELALTAGLERKRRGA